MPELHKSISQLIVKFKNDKKSLFTVALGLAGILLVFISEIPSVSSGVEQGVNSESYYTDADLCRDVEKLVSQVRGAGQVSVMLTYENDGENVYAKDTDNQITYDKDIKENQKHILIDTSQGEGGLLIKTIYPEIRGVAVVCTGADDPNVKKEIRDLLSALFNIGSNRISIAPRAEKE